MEQLTLKEINMKLLHHENFEVLQNVEKSLLEKINNTTNILDKEELYYYLIICKIRQTNIETWTISKLIKDYINIIKKSEQIYKAKNKLVKLNSNLKKHVNYIELNKINIFYKTVSHNLTYLEELYIQTLWISMITNTSIHLLNYEKNEKIKNLSLYEKKYLNYFVFVLYKYITWYGKWYGHLMIATIITVVWFAFMYYLNDMFWTKWAMVNWFWWFEWVKVWTFEYYIFVSLMVVSNLWADSSLATSRFLRWLWNIEQLTWVVLVWLFIAMLAKKIK